MKCLTIPANAQHQSRRGTTLVEVMLAAAILAMLAAMASTALFYPRKFVFNSGLEQSAINAGVAELERHLNDYADPISPGTFNTDGWELDNVSINTTTNIVPDDPIPGTYDEAEYVEISTTIDYRDGRTIELTTYRSREVLSSDR